MEPWDIMYVSIVYFTLYGVMIWNRIIILIYIHKVAFRLSVYNFYFDNQIIKKSKPLIILIVWLFEICSKAHCKKSYWEKSNLYINSTNAVRLQKWWGQFVVCVTMQQPLTHSIANLNPQFPWRSPYTLPPPNPLVWEIEVPTFYKHVVIFTLAPTPIDIDMWRYLLSTNICI